MHRTFAIAAAAALLLLHGAFPVRAASCDSDVYAIQFVACGNQICNMSARECVPCSSNAQCGLRQLVCEGGSCQMTKLQDSISAPTIAGFALVVMICALAAIAGVGPGGITVPILSLLVGFPLETCVALTNCIILGQSGLGTVLKVRAHHPQWQPPGITRPLVNWRLMSFYAPLAFCGSHIGLMISNVIPDDVRFTIMFVLFALLIYVLVKIINKAKSFRAKEAARVAALASDVSTDGTERAKSVASRLVGALSQASFMHSDTSIHHFGAETSFRSLGNATALSEATTLIQNAEPTDGALGGDASEPQYPVGDVLRLAAVLIPIAVTTFVTSPKENIIECGKGLYWGLHVAVTVWTLCVAFSAYRAIDVRMTWMRDNCFSAEESSQAQTPGDVSAGGSTAVEPGLPFKWNKRVRFMFPVGAWFAGMVTSLLGSGGGHILSYMFFEAGLGPDDTSATCTLITFTVAFEGVVIYAIGGKIPWGFGAAFIACGTLGGMIAQFLLYPQIKKRNWTFLIVAALALVLALSLGLLGAASVMQEVNMIKAHSHTRFRSLCGSG